MASQPKDKGGGVFLSGTPRSSIGDSDDHAVGIGTGLHPLPRRNSAIDGDGLAKG